MPPTTFSPDTSNSLESCRLGQVHLPVGDITTNPITSRTTTPMDSQSLTLLVGSSLFA